MILRMIPSIPFTHLWSILIISSLSKPRINQKVIIRMIPSIPFTHSWSILIISSLSKPRVTKQWSSGWFLLSHSHIHDQFLLYHHSASLVLPNSDPQDDSFYPIHTFTINSYYIITSKPRVTKQWSSGWFLLSHSHIYDQFLLYHHSASLVLPNSDPQDDSFYPIYTFMINSYYIITQQASCDHTF